MALSVEAKVPPLGARSGDAQRLKTRRSAADGTSVRRAADPSRQTGRSGVTIRIGILFVLVVALLGPITTRGAEQAGATAVDEAAFVEALNRVRADAGLPPFTVNDQLADLAREHAEVMADAGEIFHASPISAGYVGPWAKIGENVGVGAGIEVLIDAFVASPGHYANIVDPAFTEIGVGVVWRENALYTTHRFLELPGAPVTTAPPIPTTTAPEIPVPSDPPVEPSPPPDAEATAPLAPPRISADRVVTLLELFDQLGD